MYKYVAFASFILSEQSTITLVHFKNILKIFYCHNSTATGLQNAINTAIGTYNKDRDTDDLLKNVTVEVSKDGRLIVNSESGTVSFSDFGSGEAVKKLGLDSAGTKTAANGGMTLQIGANEGQTVRP